MKTINFFLFISFFISIPVVFSQNNTVLDTNSANPGQANVLIGVDAGNNLTTVDSMNNNNVMVGYSAGTNTNATIASPGNTDSAANNTFVGSLSGFSNTTGSDNVFVGCLAGRDNTVGNQNVFIKSVRSTNITSGIAMTGDANTMVGFLTGESMTSGSFNSFFGNGAGKANTSGSNNLFLGNLAGNRVQTGDRNIFIGNAVNEFATIGGTDNIYIGSGVAVNNSNINNINNTLIGLNCGNGLTTGKANTFLGSVKVPATPSTATSPGANTAFTTILADGGGNQRLYIHSNGYTGINLGNNTFPSIPLNLFEIGSFNSTAVPGSLGLRFRGVNNPNFNPSSSSNRRVLSVNTVGDVILVDDIGGGLNTSCNIAGIVPVTAVNAGVTSLVCSQIFDNGTSVGIGTGVQLPAYFNYSFPPIPPFSGGTFPVSGSGTVKMNVNGVLKAVGIFATSDKKFKKDIKSIENALTTIQAIEGKTYLWDKESNKDMNFDEGGHSGFIAQDIEKVLPHLVITGQNGDKAVNYLELLPYLVEAIKDQQTQIEELKVQLSENFKTKHNDLIALENTKIISVSPNPSNDVITISLNIDKSVQTASLQVHDLNGKLLNNLSISDRTTNINKTLQKDNFGQGVYIVSLVVNGNSIDSKKIIFN